MELKQAVAKLLVHQDMGPAGRVPGTRELVLHKKYRLPTESVVGMLKFCDCAMPPGTHKPKY